MEVLAKPRPKAFISMDSLWYEEERLATFIDWPVPFISSRELAQEGFYYLRTKDHCACAFCRGIIGAWEEGDTPRGEHKRHFPHCSFVQGKATPNVPLKQGSILSRVSLEISANMESLKNAGEDVCGTGKKEDFDPCPEGRVLTKNSNTELSMSSLGFRQYCGPKRKEYLTIEVRLNSFKHWPEKVTQTPKELAEAGFYYCGLSDHVRCFHCGNGLRNWEPSDNPWEEHARWSPDCHYVLLKKGIEFVDKVRREKPPYIPVRGNQPSSGAPSQGSGTSSAQLTDEELENLMELEIMAHVLEMGFPKNVVRTALRKKVMETGHPFFSVEACVDAILLAMEKETKNAIQGSEDITYQARKMASYESSMRNQRNQVPSSSSRLAPSEQPQQSHTPSDSSPEASSSTAFLPLPSHSSTNIPSPLLSSPSSLPPLLNISRASPPLRSSTPTSQVEGDSPQPRIGGDLLLQEMEVEESVNDTAELVSEVVSTIEVALNTNNLRDPDTELPEPTRNTEGEHDDHHLPMDLPSEVVPLISEADDIMEEAAKLLSPPSSLSTSSQSSVSSSSSSMSFQSSVSSSSVSSSSSSMSSQSAVSSSSSSSSQELEKDDSTAPKECKTESQTKSSPEKPRRTTHEENLALELERMREDQMCKVCMDSKMDVVFLPCTHMVTCSSCAVALASCPICRRDIQYAFKPIIP